MRPYVAQVNEERASDRASRAHQSAPFALLYMCHHASIYVSSCYYTCVLKQVNEERQSAPFALLYMCHHMCVLYVCTSAPFALLYMCPASQRATERTVCATIYVSSCYYICVLMLLYMCPHATMYVSSCYYICVLILLYMCPETGERGAHRLRYYICVIMLLYMCPHANIHVSAYR
jgi:hypothetical protein